MTEAEMKTIASALDLSAVVARDGSDDAADWLEMAGRADLEYVLSRAGIDPFAGAPDIREMNATAARQRARFASIRGA